VGVTHGALEASIMQFSIAHYGSVFSTRSRGARVLADLRERARADGATCVVVDFAGVRNASYSFADEFVGTLMSDAQHGVLDFTVALENASPQVQRVLDRSLSNRGINISPRAVPA
jgi:hypothetical protein